MEDEILDIGLKPLSASKVKTLENCSWVYWNNYHLKIPQIQNEGAIKGSICHTVFEMLLKIKKKKRLDYFHKIVFANSICAVKSIERLVKKHINLLKLHDTTAGFVHIDEMILVGLKNDFFVKGGTLVSPEYEFDFSHSDPTFRIRGLMDKPFIKGKKIIIDDFKSSKKKYAGEDQESNLQALFYSFAAKTIWPHLTPVVRFIFLQHPKDPIMEVKFSDSTLNGFKQYLGVIQVRVEGFNEQVSRSNFAADKPAGTDTFTGKSLCGWASHPNQLKKDGTKMWHCPYRFAYDYYAVKKDGKMVYSKLTREEIKTLKDGETVEKLHYSGCPKYVNAIDDFSSPINVKKYPNVLDDW